jgi:hypothetical protein
MSGKKLFHLGCQALKIFTIKEVYFAAMCTSFVVSEGINERKIESSKILIM